MEVIADAVAGTKVTVNRTDNIAGMCMSTAISGSNRGSCPVLHLTLARYVALGVLLVIPNQSHRTETLNPSSTL